MSPVRLLPPLRRLLRRMGGGGPAGPRGPVRFFYHPAYRQGLTGVPMDALRGERVLAWLLDRGWISESDIEEPRPASLEDLQRVHPPAYLRTLEDPAEVGRILGLPVTAEEARAAVSVQRLAAGGTLLAARRALRTGGVSMHLGGGFHHASASRGTGFCLLNDVAVAIRHLRTRGFSAPVLVVDLDLHDGNGTRSVFSRDPTVHTYSLHNVTWDAEAVVAEAMADTSIAFGSAVEDESYLAVLRRTLPPLVDLVRPALTFYVAGTDPGADDSYGDGRLSRAALLERDRVVAEATRGPLVVVLAGGYGPAAWRATGRFAAWLVTGQVEEPPDEVRVALERARRSWGGRSHETRPDKDAEHVEDPFTWSLDATDLAGLGGAETPPVLLLDRVDRARVARDLERFGILPQLRNRGYRQPFIELRGGTGLGPVVRVWGDKRRERLLVELRVAVDRRTLPGHPMLRVEWLLLQDPRADFTSARPRLPGQEHPGLGVLADVVAWLVTLCREQELHGILFRTARWHVAALASRHVHFLNEGDAERFAEALARARGRPLASVQAPSGWEEVTMVVPVGSGLAGQTYPPGRPGSPNDGVDPGGGAGYSPA